MYGRVRKTAELEKVKPCGLILRVTVYSFLPFEAINVCQLYLGREIHWTELNWILDLKNQKMSIIGPSEVNPTAQKLVKLAEVS